MMSLSVRTQNTSVTQTILSLSVVIILTYCSSRHADDMEEVRKELHGNQPDKKTSTSPKKKWNARAV